MQSIKVVIYFNISGFTKFGRLDMIQKKVLDMTVHKSELQPTSPKCAC